MIVDSTPPVTTITTGEPKFTTADGKLYVTGGTTFTLAATDNLSGVAKTEYRINGGTWTTYAPFAIAGEGTHTIEYYSKDNVANSETFRTLTVIVDNTPPVSTVTAGTPQYQADGKLYISGSTGITITAVDALSGVKRTEYSIDGGPWMAYRAVFTMSSSDGETHTIRYRSMDNVNNLEDAAELVVILDKTPPQTAISASDPMIDGVINTVSPSTFFTLSAVDALSGVRSVSYRIASGAWQAYTGSFSLAGLKAGQHAIGYKAVDTVLNEEAEKTVTVRLIVLDVTKKISTEPVVLIGAWHHRERKDNDDHREKETEKNEKDDQNKQVQKDEEDDDRKTSGTLDTLAGMLTAAGITYHVPNDEEDFVASFRSGRYNTYILLSGEEDDHEDLEKEIREAVHYGEGLIYVKTRPDEEPEIHDVLGVTFKGTTTNKNMTITLLDSPISNEGTLDIADSALVTAITSTTAQPYATMTDRNKTYPAIVYNAYGRGRAILFAFDLLAAQDRAKAAALLINGINQVHPVNKNPIALGSMPIRIKLDNSTEPADVRVKEYLPDPTTADAITPVVPVIDGAIAWNRTVQSGEKALFGYSLNIPDLNGNFRTRTELFYSNFGDYRLYGSYSLTLTVAADSADLLQRAISDLDALRAAVPNPSLCDDDDDDDNDEHEVDVKDAKSCGERINQAIRELNRIEAFASDRNAAERNIEHIHRAIERVLKLRMSVTEIRLNLDELLKVWEKKWYLMPSPKDREDEREHETR